MVKVICVQDGFVARLDEFHLILPEIVKCIRLYDKGAAKKVKEKQKTIIMNIAIRTFWPNNTHLGYKSLRGLVSTKSDDPRPTFHSKRFAVMTGK